MTEDLRFVAAIVKGIIEHRDATRHFGSLLAFQHHWRCAQEAGYVPVGENANVVTAEGRQFYLDEALLELPDCRATFWSFK